MVDGQRWENYNGAGDNYKKQQSTSVRWQRQMTRTADKRQSTVVEVEE